MISQHPYHTALNAALNLLEKTPEVEIPVLLEAAIQATGTISNQSKQEFLEWAEAQIKTPTFLPTPGQHPFDTIVVNFKTNSFYPLGGGLVQPLPTDFQSNYQRVLPSDKPTIEKKHTFCLDDSPSYEGYTLSYRWNGWECPAFEKKTAIEILKDAEMTGIFDPETNTFTITHPESDGSETVQGFPIEFNNQIITVYPIGSHSWTWNIGE